MTPPASFSAGPHSPPHAAARRTLSPAERLRALDDRKRRLHEEYAKLDRALADGRITREEYRFYIAKAYGGRLEHEALRQLATEEEGIRREIERAKRTGRTKVPVMALTLLLVIVAGMATILLSGQGQSPAAFVVVPVTQPAAFQFTAGSTAELNITNISSLRISGTLVNGSADVSIDTAEGRFLVWHGTAAPPAESVATDKESYALGETVDVMVMPADASFTLWLTDETGAKALVDDGFVPAAPGAYVLDALLNDSGNITKATTTFLVRNDTNTSKDIPREAALPSVTFRDACVDTCDLRLGAGTITLEANVTPGGSLNVTSVMTGQNRSNAPPVQAATVPDITVAQGGNVTLDLGAYFADPDNDTLTYDYMDVPGVTMRVTGSTLTLTGVSAGTGESVIYASDLSSIAQSNLFTVTVLPAGNATNATNETNATGTNNGTANSTGSNATTNVTLPPDLTGNTTGVTANATANLTANATADCSATDPNDLSIDCLYQNATDYFPAQEILLENLDREPVARFTAIGNLLIGGRIYERSAGSPGPRDFRIGYVDRDGNSVATIWIDSATGDLHLRGALHEENANLKPTPGSYSLINRRSVFLAYAKQTTGDLYLRGNVIPYRFTGVSG